MNGIDALLLALAAKSAKQKGEDMLYDNDSLTFVDRVLNPQNYPDAPFSDPDGRPQTHLMAAERDEAGEWFVFPTIVYENGKYRQFDNPHDALEHNKKTGNLVSFGGDKQGAISASYNYKPKGFSSYYTSKRQ